MLKNVALLESGDGGSNSSSSSSSSRRSSSSRGSGSSGSSVNRFLVLVVSTGCSGGAECLRKQWLVVAHYFTAFHCQISISETQNRSMGGKEKHSRGSESKKGVAAEQLVKCWLEKHQDSNTNICANFEILYFDTEMLHSDTL